MGLTGLAWSVRVLLHKLIVAVGYRPMILAGALLAGMIASLRLKNRQADSGDKTSSGLLSPEQTPANVIARFSKKTT